MSDRKKANFLDSFCFGLTAAKIVTTDFINFLKSDIETALVTKGIFPNRAKAKRYFTYFFSGHRMTWEQATEELNENELSDSIRK